jgi:hypothetical protein
MAKYRVTMWVPRYATVRLDEDEAKALKKSKKSEREDYIVERAMEDDCWVPEQYEGSEEYDVEEMS